jgi:hypothetical protein
VAAGEVHEAKRLLAKVKVDFIRERILEECADLQGNFAQGRDAHIEQPDQLTPEEAKKVAREWINGQWSRTAQIRWLMIELANLCISETLRSGQDEWGLRERLSFTQRRRSRNNCKSLQAASNSMDLVHFITLETFRCAYWPSKVRNGFRLTPHILADLTA